VLDITDRKQAEEAIRSSESRLQAMMDNTSAVIYLKDLQGRYLMINKRYEELFNVTQQQIAGKTDADIFPSEVVTQFQANDRRVMDTGQPLEFEEIVPHSDGPHVYVSVKFPVFDHAGKCTAVGGISTDISDRKRASDALAAEQEVLQHTIQFQDHERQLVAYEIHDGLVQYATGALMQLEGIQHQVESEALAQQIGTVVGILRKTVEEGRRLISGLHATVLDDCGVVAAVQELIDDEERANMQVEFVKDEGLGRMARKSEESLYRITQEALTNFYKHSQSNKVRIELSRRGDRVHLEVRDWGVGFTPDTNAKGVHGLRGMTERAKIAGGQCTIENARGGGTQVVVDLPYLSRN
jgi:PAS domain S-box-containing protein